MMLYRLLPCVTLYGILLHDKISHKTYFCGSKQGNDEENMTDILKNQAGNSKFGRSNLLKILLKQKYPDFSFSKAISYFPQSGPNGLGSHPLTPEPRKPQQAAEERTDFTERRQNSHLLQM